MRIPRAIFPQYMRGKRFESTYFTLRHTPSPTPLLAVVVSKKVAKLAVDRNRLRRRVRGVFERMVVQAPHSGACVVVAKVGSATAPRLVVQADMVALLAQLPHSR